MFSAILGTLDGVARVGRCCTLRSGGKTGERCEVRGERVR